MSEQRHRQGRHLRPTDWVVPGGHWPSGPFRDGAPPIVRYSAAFAKNVEAVLAGRDGPRPSNAAVANALDHAGHDALTAAMIGERSVTLRLVETLEAALGIDLWPTRDQVRWPR